MSISLIDKVNKLNKDLKDSINVWVPLHFGFRIIHLNGVYNTLKKEAEQKKDKRALDLLELYIENRTYLLKERCGGNK